MTESQTAGEGFVFYVKNAINLTIRNDLHMDALENLYLEIRRPRSKPVVVVTWYRPPHASIAIFSYFESLIARLDSENVEYFVMGDLKVLRYDFYPKRQQHA